MLQRPVEPKQYVSIRYTDRLAEAGIEPSVGSVGDSYYNALAETINGLYAYFGEAEQGFRLKPNENAGVPKRLFGLPKCLFGFPKPAFGKAKRIVSFRLAVLRMDQSVGIKVAPFGRY